MNEKYNTSVCNTAAAGLYMSISFYTLLRIKFTTPPMVILVVETDLLLSIVDPLLCNFIVPTDLNRKLWSLKSLSSREIVK